MLIGWLVLAVLAPDDGDLPDIAQIFLRGDRSGFATVLPEKSRIQVELLPLLHDVGSISGDQALLCFDKFQKRFLVMDANVATVQSDANYAWLEIFLEMAIRDRETGSDYLVTFAFHYKMAGTKVAASRWVLQDIR